MDVLLIPFKSDCVSNSEFTTHGGRVMGVFLSKFKG